MGSDKSSTVENQRGAKGPAQPGGATPWEELIEKAKLEVLDAISDAVIITDRDQNILWRNRSLNQKLGLNGSVSVPQKCYQIMHGVDDPPSFCQHAASLGSREIQKREVFVDKLRGPQEVTTLPLTDESGEAVGAICILRDQSDQREFQRARDESEARYRALVDHNPDGIAIHCNGEILFVNQAASEMLGYDSPDKLAGKKLLEFIHPDDRTEAKLKVNMVNSASGVAPLSDERILRPDGSCLNVEMAIIPINYEGKAAFQLVFRDITKRKVAERALRDSEERYKELYVEAKRSEELYRSLLKSSADAIIVYDLEGRARYVSDSFTEMFGWTIEDLLGSKVDYVPDSEYELAMDRIGRLIESGTPCIGLQTKRYTKDGGILDISLSASRYNDHEGKPAGILVILHDVTERNKAEELLRQSEKNRAMAEMAGGVAHNFNNLLQIIMSSAQSGLRSVIDSNESRARECLRHVLETSKHGGETVKRLQEFARVRRQGPMDEGEVFDISSTVQQAVEMSRLWLGSGPAPEDVTIEIKTSLAPGCLVKGRENEIFEVALNLVKNSAEALTRGGLIKVKTYWSNDDCFLEVSDNGVGIAEAFIPKIFDPFWTTKGIRGTGMGLASSYGIVYRHHGSIHVDSKPGEGSVFTVKLPRALEEVSKPQAMQTPDIGKRLTLLVIEDVPDILALIGEGLDEAGRRPLLASSGERGLEIFKTEAVDAVICDLGMEGLTGWDVGREIMRINKELNRPKTPFILLTGWAAQIKGKEPLKSAGVDRVLEKPVLMDKLLEVINDLVYGSDKSKP